MCSGMSTSASFKGHSECGPFMVPCQGSEKMADLEIAKLFRVGDVSCLKECISREGNREPTMASP